MIKRRILRLSILIMIGMLLFFFTTTVSEGRNEPAPNGELALASSVNPSQPSMTVQPPKIDIMDNAPPIAPRQNKLGDRFGHATAIHGDIAVIGAPQSDGGRGAVYVFERARGAWREVSRLVAGDRAASDAFGQSVAISGDTIVIGASGHDALGFNTGAAYLFQLEGGDWLQSEKLLPASPQDVHFGWSVAIDQDTVLVGAPNRYNQGEITKVGSATVFANSGHGWKMQTRLTGKLSGGAGSSDLFGWSVSIHGSTLAIGAHLTGKVHLYHLSGGKWQPETVLRGHPTSSQFGFSVSLSENRLVVGAPAMGHPAMRAGSAYLFVHLADHWVEKAQFIPDRPQSGSRFGWSVSLQDDQIAVGAAESDGRAGLKESGAVYYYRIIDERPVLVGAAFSSKSTAHGRYGHAVVLGADTILVGAPGNNASSGHAHFVDLK